MSELPSVASTSARPAPSRPWRRRALTVGLATATLALSACGAGEKLAEGALEQAVEAGASQNGADVDVDLDGEDGGFTIKGDDGTSVSIGSSELPEGFPEEMPIPDDLTIVSSSSMEDAGVTNFVVILTSERSIDEIADELNNTFTDGGWTITDESDTSIGEGDGALRSVTFLVEGHGYTGTVGVGPTTGETTNVLIGLDQTAG